MLARYDARSQETDLVVGLVNNMPPAAARSTESQFRALLASAPPGCRLRLRFFAVSGIPGQANDAASPGPHYEDLRALWDSQLDALIVTGAEPQASSMTDEPYWPALSRLVVWAADNTISTIWSCLAAHAVAFRLDGVRRQSFPEKLSGVFECTKASDHALVSDAPSRWPVPHSRYNNLDEAALRTNGYTILSSAPRVGADTFVKQVGASLFLMLQGHPEYGADCLLREYRRDIRRFLAGQRDSYPRIPEGYFDQDSMTALIELRKLAYRRPSLGLLSAVDAAIQVRPAHSWHPPALRLYARWLSYLATEKAKHAAGEARQEHDRLLAS